MWCWKFVSKNVALTFITALLQLPVYSQHQLLLDSIKAQQATNHSFYRDGLFRSQVSRGSRAKSVDDNNIFFTAVALYTLQSVRNSLPHKEQGQVDSMIAKAKSAFPFYKNRHGGITYNFYQVHPDNPFPNIKYLSKREKYRLPDDLDDTSLIYLISESSDTLNKAVKEKMMTQSLTTNTVKSAQKRYRNSMAYRTWFADKMKQDLDLCVMANVLTFVFHKQLPLAPIDVETMTLINRMIRENVHKKQAHLVSSHYQSTAVILYHLARLLSVANYPLLNELRPKIVEDINAELVRSTNSMEQVMLIASLYRLQAKTDFQIRLDRCSHDMQSFYWFSGNPFSGSPYWLKKIVGKNFLQLRYNCTGFYWALILELMVLSDAELTHSVNQGPMLSSKK